MSYVHQINCVLAVTCSNTRLIPSASAGVTRSHTTLDTQQKTERRKALEAKHQERARTQESLKKHAQRLKQIRDDAKPRVGKSASTNGKPTGSVAKSTGGTSHNSGTHSDGASTAGGAGGWKRGSGDTESSSTGNSDPSTSSVSPSSIAKTAKSTNNGVPVLSQISQFREKSSAKSSSATSDKTMSGSTGSRTPTGIALHFCVSWVPIDACVIGSYWIVAI